MKTVSMNDLEKVAGGKWPIEGAITPLQPTMEQQLNEVAPDLALSYLVSTASAEKQRNMGLFSIFMVQ